MSMTRKDFVEIADALSDAKDWAEYDGMTPEDLRQMIGKRLRTVCQISYSGSASFDSYKFNNAAKIDD
jgi:hypothetical protein